MERTIKLYQAVEKRRDSLKAPIYSKEKAWLGDGYYFWEHYIENAEYWGETHYHNNYEIYKSQYCNNKFGLDFIDCYEHREDLFAIYDTISENVNQRAYDLPTLVRLILEQVLQSPDSIHYIRIDTGTFFPKKKISICVPTQPKRIRIKQIPLIQVCIRTYPCSQIRCETYEHVYPSPPIG